VRFTVLYFAAAREAAGCAREVLESPDPLVVGDVRALLVARHPELGRLLPRCRLAVAEEMADDRDVVREGDEVAVIPPVAGGAPLSRVVDTPLSLEAVVEAVRAPGRGAVVTFEGDVRGETNGRKVVRLEYEAYVSMAERCLNTIAEEVGREHGAAVAILHRIGHLAPGEAAVVIACAAPHRTPAFRACETTIERLKHEVPIWKREVFADGSVWVGMGP
jgi:molybdopterin synthase catalytic subunit